MSWYFYWGPYLWGLGLVLSLGLGALWARQRTRSSLRADVRARSEEQALQGDVSEPKEGRAVCLRGTLTVGDEGAVPGLYDGKPSAVSSAHALVPSGIGRAKKPGCVSCGQNLALRVGMEIVELDGNVDVLVGSEERRSPRLLRDADPETQARITAVDAAFWSSNHAEWLVFSSLQPGDEVLVSGTVKRRALSQRDTAYRDSASHWVLSSQERDEPINLVYAGEPKLIGQPRAPALWGGLGWATVWVLISVLGSYWVADEGERSANADCSRPNAPAFSLAIPFFRDQILSQHTKSYNECPPTGREEAVVLATASKLRGQCARTYRTLVSHGLGELVAEPAWHCDERSLVFEVEAARQDGRFDKNLASRLSDDVPAIDDHCGSGATASFFVAAGELAKGAEAARARAEDLRGAIPTYQGGINAKKLIEVADNLSCVALALEYQLDQRDATLVALRTAARRETGTWCPLLWAEQVSPAERADFLGHFLRDGAEPTTDHRFSPVRRNGMLLLAEVLPSEVEPLPWALSIDPFRLYSVPTLVPTGGLDQAVLARLESAEKTPQMRLLYAELRYVQGAHALARGDVREAKGHLAAVNTELQHVQQQGVPPRADGFDSWVEHARTMSALVAAESGSVQLLDGIREDSEMSPNLRSGANIVATALALESFVATEVPPSIFNERLAWHAGAWADEQSMAQWINEQDSLWAPLRLFGPRFRSGENGSVLRAFRHGPWRRCRQCSIATLAGQAEARFGVARSLGQQGDAQDAQQQWERFEQVLDRRDVAVILAALGDPDPL